MFNQILFLGCGNMGSIMLNKLIGHNIFSSPQIKILKPTLLNQINNIDYYQNLQDLPLNYQADIVFICIKPQDCENILTNFFVSKFHHKNTIFISIMAGKNINFFKKVFSKKSKIIRMMPNILIQEGKGIVPFFATKNISEQQLNFLEKSFNNFSIFFPLEDEKLFHAYTAIFASSPAYIYFIAELLLDIAISHNIEKNLALKLTKQLFLGTALSLNNANNFQELRAKVTSKKGTTASAIELLCKKNSLQKLLQKAISQAIKTSKKLS